MIRCFEKGDSVKVGRRLRDNAAVSPVETGFAQKLQVIVALMQRSAARKCDLLNLEVNLFACLSKKKKKKISIPKGEDAMLSQLSPVDLPWLNCNV